jgi:hypothetical protein
VPETTQTPADTDATLDALSQRAADTAPDEAADRWLAAIRARGERAASGPRELATPT